MVEEDSLNMGRCSAPGRRFRRRDSADRGLHELALRIGSEPITPSQLLELFRFEWRSPNYALLGSNLDDVPEVHMSQREMKRSLRNIRGHSR